MNLKVEKIPDDCHLIELSGRFIENETDRSVHEEAVKLTRSGCKHFLVDLGALTHINSVGINMLVKMVKLINHNQGRVVFINVPQHIIELLTIIKLNAILEIAPSLQEGLNTLRQS